MKASDTPVDIVGGSNQLVGFISIVELSKDLFRGGMLLTDLRGKPQDFRCTSAIKPSAIQKVLYGGTLMEHMALDLCGLPLLKAMPKKPVLLLTNIPGLLVLRPESEQPVLWLRRQSETLPSAGTGNVGEACELIASEAGLFDTIMASSHSEYGAELGGAIGFIREMARAVDPLEPFDRVQAALKLVQDKAGVK